MNKPHLDKNKKIESISFGGSCRDLSIYDIQSFLMANYIVILIFAVLGLAFSIFYITLTPKQYQARAQITMAQIGASASGKFSISSANVEEPNLLILRLSNPSGIPASVSQACGNEDEVSSVNNLQVKPFKVIIPGGVPNIVELKTFGATSKLAHNCAEALTNFIQITQKEIAVRLIEEATLKLVYDEDRLAKIKNFASKDAGARSDLGLSYLYGRDEANFLLEEISTLKNIIISAQNRGAHLLAPIYVEEISISSKKSIFIIAGLVTGLFLGILVTLVKNAIAGRV